MVDWASVDNQLIDCSTISISYQPTGLANISFVVYRPLGSDPPYAPGGAGINICAGGVRFIGFVTEQSLAPATDYDGDEWRVSGIAIGCKDPTCSDPTC